MVACTKNLMNIIRYHISIFLCSHMVSPICVKTINKSIMVNLSPIIELVQSTICEAKHGFTFLFCDIMVKHSFHAAKITKIVIRTK